MNKRNWFLNNAFENYRNESTNDITEAGNVIKKAYERSTNTSQREKNTSRKTVTKDSNPSPKLVEPVNYATKPRTHANQTHKGKDENKNECKRTNYKGDNHPQRIPKVPNDFWSHEKKSQPQTNKHDTKKAFRFDDDQFVTDIIHTDRIPNTEIDIPEIPKADEVILVPDTQDTQDVNSLQGSDSSSTIVDIEEGKRNSDNFLYHAQGASAPGTENNELKMYTQN